MLYLITKKSHTCVGLLNRDLSQNRSFPRLKMQGPFIECVCIFVVCVTTFDVCVCVCVCAVFVGVRVVFCVYGFHM